MFGKKELKLQKEYYESLLAAMREAAANERALLQSQIEDLKRLVFSPTSATNIPREAREADAIITVTEVPFKTPEQEQLDAEFSELDRIVSGEHEGI